MGENSYGRPLTFGMGNMNFPLAPSRAQSLLQLENRNFVPHYLRGFVTMSAGRIITVISRDALVKRALT